ncbi:hypothetical protein EDB19DRAFT_2043832, partial [Suillus lakei]
PSWKVYDAHNSTDCAILPWYNNDYGHNWDSHCRRSQRATSRLSLLLARASILASILHTRTNVGHSFQVSVIQPKNSLVVFAYAVVTPTKAILFINDAQAQHSIKTFLGSDVEICP